MISQKRKEKLLMNDLGRIVLRIISQNKITDINYEYIAIRLVEQKNFKGLDCKNISKITYDIYGIIKDTSYFLGEYISKKRALEIMEDIRKQYVISENFKSMSYKERNCFIENYFENKEDTKKLEKMMFYEMPKE